MGDGTVFHSQEDEEKMRQHKIKLAKRNANEGRERMGEKEEGDMVPITQADNGNSPMGLSQATTISKTSNSRNSFGGEAEEEVRAGRASERQNQRRTDGATRTTNASPDCKSILPPSSITIPRMSSSTRHFAPRLTRHSHPFMPSYRFAS